MKWKLWVKTGLHFKRLLSRFNTKNKFEKSIEQKTKEIDYIVLSDF